MPMIPGADFAGEIVEMGPAVDRNRWKIRQRVATVPLRPGIGMMGETLRGAASEYCVVPQTVLLAMPDEVSFVEAACLPTAYGTALRMMQTRTKIVRGEKVLILGASGGVGTCCVQLAKLAGAEVVACASSADKVEKLKALGADHVVNTSTQNYVQETIRLHGKPRVWGESGGVDAIVNNTGGATWAECFRALKRGGRLLTCGATGRLCAAHRHSLYLVVRVQYHRLQRLGATGSSKAVGDGGEKTDQARDPFGAPAGGTADLAAGVDRPQSLWQGRA